MKTEELVLHIERFALSFSSKFRLTLDFVAYDSSRLCEISSETYPQLILKFGKTLNADGRIMDYVYESDVIYSRSVDGKTQKEERFVRRDTNGLEVWPVQTKRRAINAY